ncbi:MAG: hypothetical protein COW73_11335 [Nitrospirae bacterium CG18_big_fil_WC_8_21_14_2_50_70_55]|nr:MAG: hypothetical protein AUK30_03345 [Nitrospirae bacterium CG2_30_70_394]PIQ03414.1 MAG: hypothetical protein COW73_11335 [Nitrospirae bacterium CG18_big_fil_WC_8_21_14_2_50_70_55]PIX83992.1 MAG: hypothetical protein COZ33_02560 [Nitrospirae bacterium CG_4_10_14_3_um_filter_70_108]PJB95130.1 MAG: hypothetical protein CO080_09355 [Nitrospirae bacterium CG_4_9_14_0_8_um_filter_70_14]HBB41448.1 hypothetical protein [Pseudomonadota bacterium]
MTTPTFVPVPRRLIRRLAATVSGEQRDESAIPSYLHWNPFVRWIITRRLQMVTRMVADTLAARTAAAPPAGLDFGCGVGLLLPTLAPHLATFYLTDLDLRAASRTADHFAIPNVRLLAADRWAEVIDDGSLAFIIAADVLEHVDDLAGVVRLLAGKLEPRGALIVSGPTETLIYRLARKIAGFTGEYHVRTIFDIERQIVAAGFAPRELRCLPGLGLPTLFRVTRYLRGDGR